MIRTLRTAARAAARLALLAVTLAAPGCDANDDQFAFEQDAALPASGIARTDDRGNLLADDPDDWRTSPLYAFNGFLVAQRAYPNPARIDEGVTIVVRAGDAVPGGLRVVGYLGNLRRSIPGLREDVPGPGTYVFSFFPGEIPGAQPGDLWRLVFFDGQGHVVTYGDLQIAS